SDSEYILGSITVQFDSISDFSPRITGINVYRADSASSGEPIDDYNLVTSMDITSTGNMVIDKDGLSSKNYAFLTNFEDNGQTGASFINNTGLPESLDGTGVNYGISTAYSGYLFVGNCQKDGLPNADRYIFRSLPKVYSAFNWIQDFAILPDMPTALTGFNGRLYAFAKNNMYRINPISMVVEDDYPGVGSMNEQTVVVSNYGMFHADSENIYINDGRTSKPIGTPIQTVQKGGNSYGWKEIA